MTLIFLDAFWLLLHVHMLIMENSYLQTFPAELLVHISTYLSSHDIALLSRVSRYLHQTLEREIHRDISIVVDKDNKWLQRLSTRVYHPRRATITNFVKRLKVEIFDIEANDLSLGFEFLRDLKALEHFELTVRDYDDCESDDATMFENLFCDSLKRSEGDCILPALKSCKLTSTNLQILPYRES